MHKIKKGDLVRVIAGKDKGKDGKVIAVNHKKNTVLVEGVNYVLRIGINFYGTGAIERFKSCDHTKELHTIIGGTGVTLRDFSFEDFSFGIGVAQNSAKTTGAGVSS